MTDTYACGIQMYRPEEDLFELLQLEHNQGWNIQRELLSFNLADLNPAERYAAKALYDPAYLALYRKHRNTKALFDAGFFDDGLPQFANRYLSHGPNFVCTSVEKIRTNFEANTKSIKGSFKSAVLITTGGMAPIHNGHLEMMEQAKLQVEALGYTVIGGYFAPGHDSYVSQKYNGTAAISAVDRCAMVELAVQHSDWLELDPWAARYMPAEINFTEVCHRLNRYLRHHLSEEVKIFYVCGSDNAGFKEALPYQTIVIDRTHLSSKLAREGNHDHLDPLVRDYLIGLNSPSVNQLPYLIRNEENESIELWAGILPGGLAELERRRIQLQSAVRLGIAQLFKNANQQHKVHLLSTTDQRRQAHQVIGDQPTISLDAFFDSKYKIHSTRYFALGGSQFKPEYRAARPGAVPLEEQIKHIPPGNYVLVEDDSVTGGTIRAIKALLPNDVLIDQTVLLSDFADYQGTEYYDVVDLRDFIVGSWEGGLGVLLGDNIKGRAPYVAPFVSLRSRAKIPAEAEMELSRVIWQANVRFFSNSNIKLHDCDVGFNNLVRMIGWSGEIDMEDLCRWYADSLMEIVS